MLPAQNDLPQSYPFRTGLSGVVLDDSPYPLLDSVEATINEDYGDAAPKFSAVRSQAKGTKIEDLVGDPDFVVIDHRLEGRFESFESGIDLAMELRRKRSDLPVIYYTAFPEDVWQGSVGPNFNPQMQELLDCGEVYFYDKNSLRGETLHKFCQTIMQIAVRRMLKRLESLDPQVQRLVHCDIVSHSITAYQILDYDRRKSKQTIVCLDHKSLKEVSIPTSQLSNAGIRKGNKYIDLHVYEFDGGQVLSTFTRSEVGRSDLAPSIREMLGDDA